MMTVRESRRGDEKTGKAEGVCLSALVEKSRHYLNPSELPSLCTHLIRNAVDGPSCLDFRQPNEHRT